MSRCRACLAAFSQNAWVTQWKYQLLFVENPIRVDRVQTSQKMTNYHRHWWRFLWPNTIVSGNAPPSACVASLVQDRGDGGDGWNPASFLLLLDGSNESEPSLKFPTNTNNVIFINCRFHGIILARCHWCVVECNSRRRVSTASFAAEMSALHDKVFWMSPSYNLESCASTLQICFGMRMCFCACHHLNQENFIYYDGTTPSKNHFKINAKKSFYLPILSRSLGQMVWVTILWSKRGAWFPITIRGFQYEWCVFENYFQKQAYHR